MEYKDVRELVRIRHELRTLLAGRSDRQSAASLLDRMSHVAARDAAEAAAVATELHRWRFVFGLAES